MLFCFSLVTSSTVSFCFTLSKKSSIIACISFAVCLSIIIISRNPTTTSHTVGWAISVFESTEQTQCAKDDCLPDKVCASDRHSGIDRSFESSDCLISPKELVIETTNLVMWCGYSIRNSKRSSWWYLVCLSPSFRVRLGSTGAGN